MLSSFQSLEVDFHTGVNLYTIVLRLHGTVFGTLIITERLVQQMENKGIRELRKSKTLHRFLDFDMYRGTGLGAFRLSGSSIQEQYILKQERREEYERKRRKEQAFEEEADAMTRRVAARVASMSPEEKRAMLEKAGITIIT